MRVGGNPDSTWYQPWKGRTEQVPAVFWEGFLMSARLSLTLCATAAALALMAPDPARAQSDQPAATTGGSGLEEVVVTARRREEKAQTVPITLLTFNQEELQKQDIRDPLKLTDSVPGFNGATGASLGLTYTFLRGAPGVIFYWDQVPVDPHNQTAGFYFDMANIQVLYGPQGTLFGLSNDAGAILFEPNKPKNEFGGYGQITLGDYGRQTVEGVVNIPIVEDKLLLRVGGQYQKQDGYQHVILQNIDLLNQNYWNFRGGLTWRPTDDVTNETMINYFDTQYLPGAFTYAGYNPGPAQAFAPLTLQQLLNIAQTVGKFVPSLAFAYQQLQGKNVDLQSLKEQQEALGKYTLAGLVWTPTAVLKQLNIVNTTTWDVSDNITIKNIAAYQQIDNYNNRTDIGGLEFGLLQGPIPGLHDQPRGPTAQYNEELQLIGTFFDNRLHLQTGIFNQWGGASSGAGGSVPSNSTSPYGIQYTSNFGGISTHGNTLNQQSRTNAVYAQADYNLGDYVDGLSFTGGFRYTWDKFYSTGGNYCVVNVTGQAPCVTAANPYGTLNAWSSQNARFRSPSYTFQLNYQWRPSTMFYINNSLGYKTGGFNGQNFLDFPLFNPEHLNNYEAGVKTDFDWGAIGLDSVKSRLNASMFYGVYRGIEIQTTGAYRTPSGPSLGTPYLDVGDGDLWGWDMQWTVKPFEDLTITADAEYNKGKYKNFQGPNPARLTDPTAPAQISTPGVAFEVLPQYKLNSGFTYHFGFIDPTFGDVSLSGTYAWVQHSINSDVPDVQWYDLLPGHHNIDVSLDWTNILGHEELSGRWFMTNVTNNSVVNGCLCAYRAIGEIGYQPAQPRMWGFTLKYAFTAPTEPTAPQPAYVPPPVAAPAPKSYLVFFDFNKSDLTPQAVTIVDTAAKNAQAGKVTELTVTGHTDTVGSDAYNMRLSRRRAESVAAQLEKDGIPSSEIQIVAKGKRDLLVPTGDGVREPQNRRVQIVFDGGPTS
jgi:iron complex outermembrane receptor protein